METNSETVSQEELEGLSANPSESLQKHIENPEIFKESE